MAFFLTKNLGTPLMLLGDDDVFDKLTGIDLWIVEALRSSPHQSHSHYEQTFADKEGKAKESCANPFGS